MSNLTAAQSGQFKIGGDIEIHRLGFGAMRVTGPGIWGEPSDRAEAIRTLKRLPELGINFIDTADSYGPDISEELIQLIDDGVIRHAGLSEVSVDEIKAASRYFNVATVQNRYNLIDRGSEPVLEYCEAHKIGFIPWFPLAAGDLAKPEALLDQIAKRHAAAPSQIALAWSLRRSPVMLPIPGTSKLAHLEENVAAAKLKLSDEDFAALDREGKARAA